MMNLKQITDQLVQALEPLEFSLPVTHVYNPLLYARKPYDLYLDRYGRSPKEILLFGMNPGPWGMAQTGVPFGDVKCVRDWLGVDTPVGKPEREHPKRPIQGFACPRSEVSGTRLWGWAKNTFERPEVFFRRFFIANYCPLCFMEESGRNRTPDKLPASEQKPLLEACNLALRRTVEYLQPKYVIGIGGFAEKRAKEVLSDLGVVIGRMPHPSPASPAANRGWAESARMSLTALGIVL
ncbi:MAG: single-strand selective monofunctional uracil-DNA glycosylase [Candidatus Omnitrophota bacterium]|jgi:single-strand selective monofunctional uracil DNA glycosylase|nr:MAG: single-strand selective monofunctional uracil-DNA glycosylase [Candidatus Omnitrophota bacterium]